MPGYNGGDVPTAPNTPIAIDHSALPPGFQAMTITNPQNGATTPLYPMGNMSLPSGPAPSISSGPPAPQQQPQSRRNSIYGNPLRDSERESTPRQFGAAGPPPPAPSFSYSPQPTGSPNLPVIPVIPGMNTGTPRGTPSQRTSGLYASGTTPIMGTMGLPGGSSAGGGIYGRPGDGGPSNGPQRSPYSAVGRFQSTNDDDDADTDGFDPTTTHNTMLNAASNITMPEPVIPNAESGAKGKKPKKKKR
ncbi:hypothetical protein BDQ12DRAFT_680825 [Crucibulum laeve]|uniref:Uncharacterized protein n=1 Tax=Crucibulum laeve TaxID=68775 RepID=A0A5C3M4N9_9AGAR|nr:hypothetical protein BDQ12DRAFT_680825 [Crucibulum laeve]